MKLTIFSLVTIACLHAVLALPTVYLDRRSRSGNDKAPFIPSSQRGSLRHGNDTSSSGIGSRDSFYVQSLVGGSKAPFPNDDLRPSDSISSRGSQHSGSVAPYVQSPLNPRRGPKSSTRGQASNSGSQRPRSVVLNPQSGSFTGRASNSGSQPRGSVAPSNSGSQRPRSVAPYVQSPQFGPPSIRPASNSGSQHTPYVQGPLNPQPGSFTGRGQGSASNSGSQPPPYVQSPQFGPPSIRPASNSGSQPPPFIPPPVFSTPSGVPNNQIINHTQIMNFNYNLGNHTPNPSAVIPLTRGNYREMIVPQVVNVPIYVPGDTNLPMIVQQRQATTSYFLPQNKK